MDAESQIYKGKRGLEIGCTAMGMYLSLLNCKPKNGYNDNFCVMYISPRFKFFFK